MIVGFDNPEGNGDIFGAEASVGEGLVQKTEGIPQAAAAFLGNIVEGFFVPGNLFRVQDDFESLHNGVVGYFDKVKAKGP